MPSRRAPLIAAWVLVAAAVAAAAVYVYLAPGSEPDPSAGDDGRRGEVRISLSEIPTLPETDAGTPAPGLTTARQSGSGAAAETATSGGSPAVDGPKIAIVVSGLGLSEKNTAAAVKALPAAVTLSFTPYGENLAQWIADAQAAGHEVMIDLPMEPASFPSNDPGPKALTASLSAPENQARLAWILDRGSGFVGVTAVMGSRFSRSRELMQPVLQTLKDRGLLYLDNRATDLSVAGALADEIGLPRAINDRTLDESHASQVVIEARLAQIERLALTHGFAVAIAHPFPLTLERLANWSETLAARGFTLVPISAVANRQPPP